MKVILLEDIKGTGKKGQVINASDGHAKNFLIPRKLAVEANENNLKDIERKKKAEESKRLAELEEAKAFGKQIEELKIKISVKIGENGKLFGSVTNKEIAESIEQIGKLKIDKKKIVLDEPIKSIGTKQITIKIHPDVSVKINVEIVEAK